MAGREDLEVKILMPKAITDRNQLKYIPEVCAAFSEHARVVGDALLQVGQQGGRHIEGHEPRLGCKAQAKEQAFQATDMVQVQMGDEECRRQASVVFLIAWQGVIDRKSTRLNSSH